MRTIGLFLVFAACTGAPAPRGKPPAQPGGRFIEPTARVAEVDEEWEYKISLALLDRFEDYLEVARRLEPSAKLKKCRTVQFWDTPDRALRADGRVIRVRIKREARGTCLDAHGQLAAVDEVDLTHKGVAAERSRREAGAPPQAERETDWMTGQGEARLRYSWKAKQELDAPGDVAGAMLVAIGPALAKKVQPVCRSHIEQLTIDLDRYELTIWRYEGTILAAEASFDGVAGEQARARQLREELSKNLAIRADAVGKTEALFQRCAAP